MQPSSVPNGTTKAKKVIQRKPFDIPFGMYAYDAYGYPVYDPRDACGWWPTSTPSSTSSPADSILTAAELIKSELPKTVSVDSMLTPVCQHSYDNLWQPRERVKSETELMRSPLPYSSSEVKAEDYSTPLCTRLPGKVRSADYLRSPIIGDFKHAWRRSRDSSRQTSRRYSVTKRRTSKSPAHSRSRSRSRRQTTAGRGQVAVVSQSKVSPTMPPLESGDKFESSNDEQSDEDDMVESKCSDVKKSRKGNKCVSSSDGE